MEFDIENPLGISHQDLSPDTTVYLFTLESDHMPLETYHQSLIAAGSLSTVRRETISLLSRRHGAVTFYLAVNYLDRFLSSHPLPEGRPWISKLLAVSCVILALKMRKTEFSVAEIQQEVGVTFDLQTIERMEMLILGALNWRMRSVTPFCFLNFFMSPFKFKDPPLREALKERATQIIFNSQTDMKLLKFRPSIICAAALLSACDELFPLQFDCFKNATLNSPYVNAEDMLRCYSVTQDITSKGSELESKMDTYNHATIAVSSSSTPVNVLDMHLHHHQSTSTDNDAEISGGGGGAIMRERDFKRRRFDDRFSIHRNSRCNK